MQDEKLQIGKAEEVVTEALRASACVDECCGERWVKPVKQGRR